MEDTLEIAKSLGNMEGKVDTLLRHTTTLFDKYDGINEAHIEQRGQLKLLASQVADLQRDLPDLETVALAAVKAVSEKTAATDRRIDAYENKGKGMAIAASFFGVGGLAAFAAAVKTFFFSGGPPHVP